MQSFIFIFTFRRDRALFVRAATDFKRPVNVSLLIIVPLQFPLSKSTFVQFLFSIFYRHMAEVKSRILHEAMKARENGIRGVPYITFFINGRMGTNLSGARAADDYSEIFQHLLTKLKAGA